MLEHSITFHGSFISRVVGSANMRALAIINDSEPKADQTHGALLHSSDRLLVRKNWVEYAIIASCFPYLEISGRLWLCELLRSLRRESQENLEHE